MEFRGKWQTISLKFFSVQGKDLNIFSVGGIWLCMHTRDKFWGLLNWTGFLNLSYRGVFGTFDDSKFTENFWEFHPDIVSRALFSKALLTDGDEVPNDRCCRVCGKIGHFVKDCPLSRKNKNKFPEKQQEHLAQQKCFACNETGHYAKVTGLLVSLLLGIPYFVFKGIDYTV